MLFVTSNKHKFAEAKSILKGMGITVKHLSFSYPELQLDDAERIAEESAKFCFDKFAMPLFIEDSGLFIPGLAGFPGPFTSYVERTIGNKGLLALAKGKKAEAQSIVTYIDSSGIKSFVGKVKGTLVSSRGKSGFGFDPIFQPDGYDKTFGQDMDLKNSISHRRKSIEKFAKWLKDYGTSTC